MRIPTGRSYGQFLFLLIWICSKSLLASDCTDLYQTYRLSSLSTEDLTELSQDIFMGIQGAEWSITDRLCMLHSIHSELYKRYDYNELIALGRRLEMLSDLGVAMDRDAELLNYERLSASYLELGVGDSCVYYADRAESFLDPSDEEQLVRLLELRQVKLMGYVDLLQFEQAEKMLEESEGYIKATEVMRPEWARLYYDKAMINYYFGDFEKMDGSLDHALKVLKMDMLNFEKLFIKCLTFKGKSHIINGDLIEAEKVLNQCLEILETSNVHDEKAWVVNYMNLTHLHTLLGNKSMVYKYMQKAKNIAESGKKHPFLTPKIYLFNSANYLDFNDFKNAMKSCEMGISILSKIDRSKRQKKLFGLLATSLTECSKNLFYETRDSILLKKAFESSLKNLDYLKYYSIGSNKLGNRFNVTRLEQYDMDSILAVLSVVDEKYLEADIKAHYFDVLDFEKAQQINFSYLSKNIKLTEKEEDLVIGNLVNVELFEMNSNDILNDYISTRNQQEKENRDNTLVYNYLSSNNLKNRYEAFLNFSKSKNEIIVNYHIDKEELKILSCYKGEMQFRTVKVGLDSMKVLCSKYLGQLEKVGISENSINDFLEHSKQLYTILVRPIENPRAKKIIFIPHGPLSKISFETLCDENSKSLSNGWDLPYLIKDYDIGYANSMQSYQLQESQELMEFKTNVISIAPSFSSDSNLDAVRNNLSTLKYNIEEANYIANVTAGISLAGKEANINQLLSFAENANILHFATHSFMDSTHSFPSIVLAHENGELNEYKKLNLTNYFEDRINANMVVLSACETAIGPIEFGDGMIGIPQSLMKLNVKSVVSSLWEINDKSTTEIMKEFYLLLSSQNDISYSLSESKRKYIQLNSGINNHPYFWSGLISYGRDSSPMNLSSKWFSKRTYLIALAVIVLLLSLVFLKS